MLMLLLLLLLEVPTSLVLFHVGRHRGPKRRIRSVKLSRSLQVSTIFVTSALHYTALISPISYLSSLSTGEMHIAAAEAKSDRAWASLACENRQ